MKKVHWAVQKGQNRWERKTGWLLDVDDIVSLAILLIVIGFVVIRSLISQPERCAGSTPAPAEIRADWSPRVQIPHRPKLEKVATMTSELKQQEVANMSNELKDIANRLSDFKDENGWQIVNAKKADGKWFLVIEEITPAEKKEAAHDND